MRKPGQKVFWLFAGIIACADLSAVDASAQGYPTKPIRIVVGFVPGGAVDFTARLVAPKLSENLGQSVVVENRPGAGSSIGTERVAAAAPDGYTLLMMASSGVVQSVLRTDLPYVLERDLAPVSLVATGAYVLAAHPSVPVRSVADLIALARSQPGKLSYGASGAGDASQLAAELFLLRANVKLVHVPYKGSGEAVIATAAGQVPVSFTSIAGALSLIESGRLRPLAVTSVKRISLLPSTPTVDESGVPGYEYSPWYGVLAPAGVPKDVIARLNAAIDKAVNTPATMEAFKRQCLEPRTNTPEQFAAFIRNDIVLHAKLIEIAGVKAAR